MAEHVRYSDEEIAHALAVLRANGGNAKKTSIALGIPRTTLRQWAGRAQSETARPRRVASSVVRRAEDALASRWERIASVASEKALAAIEMLDPAALRVGQLRDLVVQAAIATDKQQLLRGGATSRVENVRVSYVDAGALRARALLVIEDGRAGPLALEAGDVARETMSVTTAREG